MDNQQKYDLQRIVEPLLLWYRKNARVLPWRENTEPYRVWVSEIMLQQTRVSAVKEYYLRFMEVAPDIQTLADMPEEQLMKLWEGLGYYARARHLQAAARQIVERCNGEFPGDYEEILRLPGIGPYTAGAVASIAFQIPVAAVDGNVLRVLARLRADRHDIADAKTKAAAVLAIGDVIPKDAPGDFTQAMMELGAIVCLPNGEPLCEHCPLKELCMARQRGIAMQLPVKKKKAARRVEQKTVLVMLREKQLALRKRNAKGLLASMWELPAIDGTVDEARAREQVEGYGFEVEKMTALATAKHIFTHVEWHMSGFLVRISPSGSTGGFHWVNEQAMHTEYAVPSAFQSFLAVFREEVK